MINGDNPLFAFIPPRYHNQLKSVLDDLEGGNTSTLVSVKEFCWVLHDLLQKAYDCKADDVFQFVDDLMELIRKTFSGEIESQNYNTPLRTPFHLSSIYTLPNYTLHLY